MTDRQNLNVGGREFIGINCFVTGYAKEPGGTLTISPRKLIGKFFEADKNVKLLLPSGLVDRLRKYYFFRNNVTVFVLKSHVERKPEMFNLFL